MPSDEELTIKPYKKKARLPWRDSGGLITCSAVGEPIPCTFASLGTMVAEKDLELAECARDLFLDETRSSKRKGGWAINLGACSLLDSDADLLMDYIKSKPATSSMDELYDRTSAFYGLALMQNQEALEFLRDLIQFDHAAALVDGWEIRGWRRGVDNLPNRDRDSFVGLVSGRAAEALALAGETEYATDIQRHYDLACRYALKFNAARSLSKRVESSMTPVERHYYHMYSSILSACVRWGFNDEFGVRAGQDAWGKDASWSVVVDYLDLYGVINY